MSFTPTPEQQAWVDKARALGPTFASRARRYDEAAEFPAENFDLLREEGFLSLAVPREYGGLGTGAGYCEFIPHAVVETVAEYCGSTGWALLTHLQHCGLLAGMGSEEQKTRVFKDVVENGALMGSLGSEVMPQQLAASADTKRNISFTAGFEPVDGGFIANATKGFCSMASVSDYLFYWALAPGTETNAEGLTVALVTKGSPGLSFLPGWEEAIGLRGSQSGGAKLENVFIPWENVLGQPGDFIQSYPYTVEITYAVQLLGIAQGAYDFIRKVLGERPYLQADDTVMYTVGEMSSALQATRMSWWYAQSLWDAGSWDEAAHATMRALHAAKTNALMITTKAFDVVGVRALFKFNPLERAWRDVRTVTLHTRESQLMRLLAEGDISGQKFVKEKYGPRLEPSQRKTWDDLGLRPENRAAAPAAG
jgi:alkylation response protein AidB-like acyl-CoA dehydrogenase